MIVASWQTMATHGSIRSQGNTRQRMATISPGRYRHYKGNEYTVLGVAQHSETLEQLIVYSQEYGDRSLWVRPAAMFSETVVVDGKTVPRFQLIEVGSANR